MRKTFFTTFLNIIFPTYHEVPGWQQVEMNDLHQKSAWRKVSHIPNTYALMRYKDPLISELLWALKYHHAREVAPLFGECLSSYLVPRSSNNTVLVPIPLSRARLLERGYNQCTEIARSLTLPVIEHALTRKESSEHQARLKKVERIQNIKGVFSVATIDAIQGKHVILLDDVLTTGATLGEARRVLLEAGAHDVMCVTIAH